MLVIAALIYNLAVLAGTAYLVQFYDWSPWWFLLAAGLVFTNLKTK